VCCSVLQCVAVCCRCSLFTVVQCVAVCCGELQCVAVFVVCCSVSQIFLVQPCSARLKTIYRNPDSNNVARGGRATPPQAHLCFAGFLVV